VSEGRRRVGEFGCWTRKGMPLGVSREEEEEEGYLMRTAWYWTGRSCMLGRCNACWIVCWGGGCSDVCEVVVELGGDIGMAMG